MRLLQVGAGGWGESWARVVASSPHWESAGLVDLDAAALARVGDDVGVPHRWTSIDQAVREASADAALVAVPPPAHRPVAEAVLRVGLHCLVEKPLAETLADARAIVDAAEAAGRLLMVSQNYRFKRAPRTVRRLIGDGAIGQIGAVYARFFHAPPFTGFRVEMAQPLIVDMAVHHFDQIRGTLGLEPVEVRARSFNPPWSWFRGDASANVEFATREGAIVSYTGSWVSRIPPSTWDGDWDIHGDRGAIRWSANRVQLYPSEFGDTVYRPGAVQRAGNELDVELEAMAEEERWGVLAEFAAAIEGGRQPETSGRDNIRSLALVLGAVESAVAGGRPVALDTDDQR